MREDCRHYDTHFIGKPFCGASVTIIEGSECNKNCPNFEKSLFVPYNIRYKIICGSPTHCERELNKLTEEFKVKIIKAKNRSSERLLLIVEKTPL